MASQFDWQRAINPARKDVAEEIINSAWIDLEITNLSYWRFHIDNGIVSIGNASELYEKFWNDYCFDCAKYILRMCDGKDLWAYSKEHTIDKNEVELFIMRNFELNLPNGLIKVIYRWNYIDIYHFASSAIALQKYSLDVVNKIEKINIACTITSKLASTFFENNSYYMNQPKFIETIQTAIHNARERKKQKLWELFYKIFDCKLTDAEVNCLTLLLKGRVAKQIAYENDNSIKTIEKHLTSLRKKSHSQSTNELIAKILSLGVAI